MDAADGLEFFADIQNWFDEKYVRRFNEIQPFGAVAQRQQQTGHVHIGILNDNFMKSKLICCCHIQRKNLMQNNNKKCIPWTLWWSGKIFQVDFEMKCWFELAHLPKHSKCTTIVRIWRFLPLDRRSLIWKSAEQSFQFLRMNPWAALQFAVSRRKLCVRKMVCGWNSGRREKGSRSRLVGGDDKGDGELTERL